MKLKIIKIDNFKMNNEQQNKIKKTIIAVLTPVEKMWYKIVINFYTSYIIYRIIIEHQLKVEVE